MVSLLNLQEIARAQSMDLPVKALVVLDHPCLLLSKSQQINASLCQNHEVIRGEQESFDLALPKLVAFMPILYQFSL